MDNTINKMESWAPVLLRIGMSLVFLWFGSQQLLNPETWMSFVPDFVSNMVPASTVVLANGFAEIVLGLALIIGFQVKWAALLLALHLLGIAISMGLTPTGVRDLGLTIATFSIFLYGKDRWSIS